MAVLGEVSQELPVPAHFEQAAGNVTPEMVGETLVCGPDPQRHIQAVSAYLEAGFDEVYISQIGDDQAGFLDFFNRAVRPHLGL